MSSSCGRTDADVVNGLRLQVLQQLGAERVRRGVVLVELLERLGQDVCGVSGLDGPCRWYSIRIEALR